MKEIEEQIKKPKAIRSNLQMTCLLKQFLQEKVIVLSLKELIYPFGKKNKGINYTKVSVTKMSNNYYFY